MSTSDRIYILDTSSLIKIKSGVMDPNERQRVWKALTALAAPGRLRLVREVINELRDGRSDCEARQWADSCRHLVEANPRMPSLVAVMASVPGVQDDSKEKDDADAYLLALADEYSIAAAESDDVVPSPVVVTEERKDGPHKISIATACGMLHLVCVNAYGFLASERIYFHSDALRPGDEDEG